MSESPPSTLHRALGRWTAVAMVVGSVIGAGIFFKPQRVAEELGSFDLILAVWVVAGVVCLFGALSLAELAAMLPRAGGLYVYLREAYGKPVAFLYGWSLFAVVRPAATGGLATAFAESFGAPPAVQFAIAVGVILLVAWTNIMGVVWGGRLQRITTLIKAAFLAGIAVLPWLTADVQLANFGSTYDTGPDASGGNFMVALLAVMFAYNSWHEVTPLAEEIKEPQRNVPWALLVGIGLLITLYVGANVAYHGVLPMETVATESNTAAAVMGVIAGPAGGTIMTALVLCSVFGTINANLMHAPRVYFAMGRDGVFFRALGTVHRTRLSPAVAIGSQATLAIVLIVVSTLIARRGVFDQLTNIVVFGASVFYALAILAVLVLRHRQPQTPRPYKAIGYPVTPVLFVLAYAWFLPAIFLDRPLDSGIGLGVIALGIPIYWYWRRRSG